MSYRMLGVGAHGAWYDWVEGLHPVREEGAEPHHLRDTIFAMY